MQVNLMGCNTITQEVQALVLPHKAQYGVAHNAPTGMLAADHPERVAELASRTPWSHPPKPMSLLAAMKARDISCVRARLCPSGKSIKPEHWEAAVGDGDTDMLRLLLEHGTGGTKGLWRALAELLGDGALVRFALCTCLQANSRHRNNLVGALKGCTLHSEAAKLGNLAMLLKVVEASNDALVMGTYLPKLAKTGAKWRSMLLAAFAGPPSQSHPAQQEPRRLKQYLAVIEYIMTAPQASMESGTPLQIPI